MGNEKGNISLTEETQMCQRVYRRKEGFCQSVGRQSYNHIYNCQQEG